MTLRVWVFSFIQIQKEGNDIELSNNGGPGGGGGGGGVDEWERSQ